MSDDKEVIDFIKANGFAILLSTNNKHITGTHIPLQWTSDPAENEVLYGHIALGNPQCQDLRQLAQSEDEVLCIFNGPHAYVSSSWYSHENVPTWNYIAVHVYGQIELLDEEETYYSLDRLMNKYEAGQEQAITLDGLSENTLKQIKGILAFKIKPTQLQGKRKLSQNRNEEDYHAIIEHLQQEDGLSKNVAAEMERLSDTNSQLR